MSIKPTFSIKRLLRLLCQIICLAVFLILFRLTDYRGKDEIGWAVNVLFRLDPLSALTAMLAAKEFIALFIPALILVVLTMIFGRFFCGWICPLGTLLDLLGKYVSCANKKITGIRYVKYILLTIIIVSAVFGLQLSGFFNPFSILVRCLAYSVDPVLNYVVCLIFDSIYLHGPEVLSSITEPVYGTLKQTLLPFSQSFFALSFFCFIMLLVIFLIEKITRRFWCRNLCPLGGMLALLSLPAFLRRIPEMTCKDCNDCAVICPMDAFGDDGCLKNEECTLCLDCISKCPSKISSLKFGKSKKKISFDLNKRFFIKWSITGAVISLVLKASLSRKIERPFLLRPPGVDDEQDFLSKCVRCGECMKVCVKNALQPAFMESGFEGMFTPRLVPRFGYCEFNCTLCGQVCPSGAIKRLDVKQKQSFVIGLAVFDRDRCLPFAKDESCIVCEEHCPTYDKAIKFKDINVINGIEKEISLKQPYVVDSLCIGCGICENVCPLEGNAAVRVISQKNLTSLKNS